MNTWSPAGDSVGGGSGVWLKESVLRHLHGCLLKSWLEWDTSPLASMLEFSLQLVALFGKPVGGGLSGGSGPPRQGLEVYSTI